MTQYMPMMCVGDIVDEVVSYGLEEAERRLNRRFTFLVDGRIDSYLDRMVVNNKGLTKSEFICGLIEDKVRKEDFKS